MTSFARVGRARNIVGDEYRTVTDMTFDSSYPTGGEAVTAANLGLRKINHANVVGASATGAGVNVANAIVDLTNSKVLLYDETPAQVADNADVQTAVVRIEAYGK